MIYLNARNVLMLGFALRMMIAVWNGFFGPSFGADLDALGFHLQAVDYAHNLEFDAFRMGWIYSYLLGIVYHFVAESLFLGSLLSCLAWLLSAKLLAGIMRLLSVSRRQQLWAMLVYALLPSSLLFTAVTLREPYQLLFVNLALYSSLMICLQRSQRHWIPLLLGVACMGLLHGALLAFGIFLIAGTLFMLSLRPGGSFSTLKLLVVLPLVALVLSYGFSCFSSISYNLDNGLVSAVQGYQMGGLKTDARTVYRTDMDFQGGLGLFLFIPVSLFQYLFEPMPWHISSAVDVPTLIENLLRGWLLWRSMRGASLASEGRAPLLFLLVCFLGLELTWSLGTINWGTAVRHHLPSLGILTAAAFAPAQVAVGKAVRTRNRLALILYRAARA